MPISSKAISTTALSVVNGRLTLQSGVAISTSNQLAKAVVYFTPYQGNRLLLYSGSSWREVKFSEIGVVVPSTVSKNFDVFAYSDNGVFALETVNWATNTARATVLAKQDGVYVKAGDATRRYLGTGRTTGVSGECEDSTSSRFLWNYYNRIGRCMIAQETIVNWVYSTAVFRPANGNTTVGRTRVQYVEGISEDEIVASVHGGASNSGADAATTVGIGVDSTTATSAQSYGGVIPNGAFLSLSAHYNGHPGIGYHFLQWLEVTNAIGTVTWRGKSSGGQYFQMGLRATVKG